MRNTPVIIVEELSDLHELFISTLRAKGIAVMCTHVHEVPALLKEHADTPLIAFCNASDPTAIEIIRRVRDSKYQGILLAASNDPTLQEKQMAAGCTHRLSEGELTSAVLPKTRLTERIADLLTS